MPKFSGFFIKKIFLQRFLLKNIMFAIEMRYQHWSEKGLTWTKWFIPYMLKFRTESEARNRLKSMPTNFNKLQYEYRIVNI